MSVRVRFAPSPTGYLHVGNIRAALINWLFARREGGVFILRLDDTDADRSEAHFAEAIVEDLAWLGLTPDETYHQSTRFDRYEAAAETLKAAGRLYPCYETAEELEIKRKIQISQKKPPVYDRAALKLSEAEIAAFEAEGRKLHWRFRIDLPARIEFTDLIRGPVAIDLATVSDPILIREDGSYLYTLPSVADDLDMKISHVIRGEDHVTNSAVQVQLYEALGGKAPEFAHFALLAGAEGAGLSKRERTLAVRELRDRQGIEPMALVSLLARIGTSDPVEPFLDPAPLIDSFDFGKLTRATAHFDLHELEALNAKILHQTGFAAVKDRLGIDGADEAFWLAVRPNLTRLSDAADWWHIVHGAIEPVIEDKEFLAEAADVLPAGTLDDDSWPAWTKKLSAETDRKGRALFHPLRLALTGREKGPEMRALLPLIGRERALKRLKGEAA